MKKYINIDITSEAELIDSITKDAYVTLNKPDVLNWVDSYTFLDIYKETILWFEKYLIGKIQIIEE